MTFVAILLPTVMVVLTPPKGRDIVSGVLLYVLFISLAAPLLWEVSRFALGVSTEGLDCRSPWRRRFFICWGDVEQLRYSTVCQWFIIRTWEGRTFRVSANVAGVIDFLAVCEVHLTPSQLAPAKAGYAFVSRPFPEPRDPGLRSLCDDPDAVSGGLR
jgi:hypothetical protein